ncbi:M23 family metallopeptidase [Cyanobium sp. WKJ7-Wakatipu]|uniref:M23 family metallopeptidase n=1 Tax=Cyanobium sp. WKJ7-Wakatipu TaxID=2823726 RepID=UPI0020CFCDF7|nr:M23 family metallopeptidase [Cyanobium sp. WKJ7-Wakatipu]MCP9784620.1 M23 family metallopeptidase [Cyanobium sp. WKJ7-Wakatipu]
MKAIQIFQRSFKICLPALALAIPSVVVAFTAPDSSHPGLDQLIAALPAPSPDRIWVKLRQHLSLESLSADLGLPDEQLANLNNVSLDHEFRMGDWLVLPSQKTREIKRLPAVDTSELRRTPPLESQAPLEQRGVVRLGETLSNLAQRYGLTLQELLRLNPGLEGARLVAGSQIQVAQATPGRSRMVLGLKPTTSGGISWPEQPDFGEVTRPFGQPITSTGWVWPTRGVFTSGYGWRWGRIHKGIDVANNVGTPIVAAKEGRVVFAGWNDGGYGYLVTLAHPDGSRSIYAHNSRLLVKVGQEVQQGQAISQMGSTGRSTGPHLHFEIHPAKRGAINPLQLLPQRA